MVEEYDIIRKSTRGNDVLDKIAALSHLRSHVAFGI